MQGSSKLRYTNQRKLHPKDEGINLLAQPSHVCHGVVRLYGFQISYYFNYNRKSALPQYLLSEKYNFIWLYFYISTNIRKLLQKPDALYCFSSRFSLLMS